MTTVKKVIAIVGVLVMGVIVVAFVHNFRASRLTPERVAQIREAQQKAMQEEALEMAEEQAGMSMADVEAKYPGKILARITTPRGVVVLTLYDEEAPVTVANFVNLASRGYFDGLTFHRVIPNFMVQTGDPTGTGYNGPGYAFEDEISDNLIFDRSGLLAMANSGANTNGSQFFITHVPCPHLDKKHTIFGCVLEGQPVVDAIQQGDQMVKVELGGPYQRVLDGNADRIAEWNSILDQNNQ